MKLHNVTRVNLRIPRRRWGHKYFSWSFSPIPVISISQDRILTKSVFFVYFHFLFLQMTIFRESVSRLKFNLRHILPCITISYREESCTNGICITGGWLGWSFTSYKILNKTYDEKISHIV